MTEPVTYLRGDGGYVLTVAERDELTGLRIALQSQLEADNTKPNLGLGLPIYTFLLGLISEEVEVLDPEMGAVSATFTAPLSGGELPVMRWIRCDDEPGLCAAGGGVVALHLAG